MRYCIIIVLTLLSYSFSLPIDQGEIKTGIVPIFDSRITMEPITFTFTTPKPSEQEKVTKYPTLGPNTFEPVVKNSYYQSNDNWQTYQASQNSDVDVANIIQQNNIIDTPLYNQAQYFKAIQSLSQQQPVAPTTTSSVSPTGLVSSLLFRRPDYSQIWGQISSSWQKVQTEMQDNLKQNGADADWSRLLQKITGAIEPFMSQFGEQMGRAVNLLLRNYQSRMRKQTGYDTSSSYQQKTDNQLPTN